MTSALILTRDSVLRDEVVRVASAAGVDVDTPAELGSAGVEWRRAPVVVVGADSVDEVAACRWARRAGVMVTSWGPPAERVYRPALEVGADIVLEMPHDAEKLAERLADVGEGRVSRAVVVGVIGGSGGAGATTLSVALAQAASPRRRVLLVDTDVLGPGLDAVLGTTDAPGVRWSELYGSSGRLAGRSVREALPAFGSLPFLTWSGVGRLPSAELVREVIASARRANDLVVVDLSRALDPVVVEALAACDLVLMVVRPTTDGLSAARRLLAQLPDRERVRAVVRGPADPRAGDLEVPVVAHMREQRGVAEAIALGLGPVRGSRGPIARAAHSVLEWLQGGAT